MDFISKILGKPSKSGGGGGSSTASTTPATVNKPDHEAHVQFAREFVVELVETIPKKSEKAALAKHPDKEDIVSLKSVSPSESSFQTVSSIADNSSLPDLLQPEFVYKKQTDTDTDTAEYESAAETDPATSPIETLIAEDLLAKFQEALDKKYQCVEKESPLESCVVSSVNNQVDEHYTSEHDKLDENKANSCVSQGSSDPSPISEAYEDANDALEKTLVTDVEVKPLDISGLCLFIDNLHLDCPGTSENCNISVDHKDTENTLNPSFDIPIAVSGTEVSENCVELEKFDVSNTSEVNISCVISESVLGVNGTNEDVSTLEGLLEANKTFDSDVPSFNHDSCAAENHTSVTTDEQLEIQLNKTADESEVQSVGKNQVQSIDENQTVCIHKTDEQLQIKLDKTADGSEVESVGKNQVQTINEKQTVCVPKTDEQLQIQLNKSSEESRVQSVGNNQVQSIDEKQTVCVNSLVGSDLDQHQVLELEQKDASIVNDIPLNQVISTEFATEKCVNLEIKDSPVCENIESTNKEQNFVDLDKNSDKVKESDLTELNSISVEVDTNPTVSVISGSSFEEVSLIKSTTESSEEKVVENKSSPDLDSTWTSASLEVLCVEKDITETAVESKKSDSKAETFLQTSGVPDLTNVLIESASGISAESGAGDWEPTFKTDQEPTVLSKLFEICDRQQKDLELGDEKFVDGTEFFASPSKNASLRQPLDLPISSKPYHSEVEESILDRSVPSESVEFDQSIADEAEKILQEIINASSEFQEASLRISDITRSSIAQQSSSRNTSIMADQRGLNNATVDENETNPFATQSSLRRSPPPSGKPSPRSTNQGASPSDSPRVKSRLSAMNAVKEDSLHDHASGDASPRSRSGKNSPDRRTNRVDGSLKNTINPEMNQSEAGPDIAEDAHVQSGDVFQDPAAFEYLSSLGSSHPGTDLRKESLYVKFDPLVGGGFRTTDNNVPLPPAVEANSVNTAPFSASPTKDQQSGNTTPVKNPAMSVIEKLISLSPAPVKPSYLISPVKQPILKEPIPVKEVHAEINYSQNMVGDNASMTEELYLLREVIAKQDEKHREKVVVLQKEVESLRVHVENLQSLVRESEDRETKLNKKVAEKAQAQKQMSIIMEEYEKTISRLVAEKEQERQAHELDKSTLLKDRDAAMGHLANIEIAFSDLHKKYERSKTVIEGFKKNEEVLRASLAEYEATIRKQEQKYEVLKSHAMAQLENANQELDSVRRSQQAETAKLKAMLKKAELKTSSLEEMLEQKVKENQELASICDELINKVGSSE